MLVLMVGCQTPEPIEGAPLEPLEIRCHTPADSYYGEYEVRWGGDASAYRTVFAAVHDPRTGAAWTGAYEAPTSEWLWTAGPPCGMGVVTVAGFTHTDTES